jgi:hypothetical protein
MVRGAAVVAYSEKDGRGSKAYEPAVWFGHCLIGPSLLSR